MLSRHVNQRTVSTECQHAVDKGIAGYVHLRNYVYGTWKYKLIIQGLFQRETFLEENELEKRGVKFNTYIYIYIYI